MGQVKINPKAGAGFNQTETGKFIPYNNIMPDRFNSISEPRLYPFSTIGIAYPLNVDNITTQDDINQDSDDSN